MQRWKFITPLVLISIVSVAYYTGGKSVPMDNDNTSVASINEKAAENALDKKLGGFGADVDLGAGLFLNVSDPIAFKPKDPEALGVEGRPLIMNITISNKSAKTIDLSSFSIIESAFDSDPSLSCFDIFEAQSQVVGAPENSMLAAGKSISFKWAIVCPTIAGDKLHLTFSVTGNEEVTFDSTVK